MMLHHLIGSRIIFALCALLLSTGIRASNAQERNLTLFNNEVYATWLENATYDKSTFLPSTTEGEGVGIHWTVDETMIYLALVAPATGWAAFGLAESGSMRGADILLYTAETDTLIDSYVLDQLVTPFPDDCQSWELVHSVVEDGIIIVEAKRLLNTSDTQDRVIIDDSLLLIQPTRVIAAWGNTSEPSYHGPSRARGSIRFFGASDITDEDAFFAQTMANEAEGNFTVHARGFVIPSNKTTTYGWFCYSRQDLLDMGVPLDQDLHTIGIEPLITPGNEKYVHHFVLYGSSLPFDSAAECNGGLIAGIENAYAWAPGDLPFTLPPNVGGPLGSNGFQSFALQIHYNNADLDANVLDSSGIRAYYTSIKREFDLGIFQTGDPYAQLNSVVSANGGLSQHSFQCEPQCLGKYLTQPVTVFREVLHMHATGVSASNYLVRNDQVVHEGRVDYFDFAQQGDLSVVQAPFQIYPGDSVRTVCNYNAPSTVEWGLGSEEEMCITFIFYYPRQLIFDAIPIVCGIGTLLDLYLPDCVVTYAATPDFTNETQLERTFGVAPLSCPNNAGSSPTSPVSSPTNIASTSSAMPAYFKTIAPSVYGLICWTILSSIW